MSGKKSNFAVVVVVAVLAAACGDSLEVKSVKAKGSVGGIIVDGATRVALEGVEVSILAGGRAFDPVITEADGNFRFKDVPGGEVLVFITAPAGYGSAWIRDELPRATGDFPSGNSILTIGPIGLVPMTRAFGLRVLNNQGAPVPGYQVTLQTFPQWIDLQTGFASGRGEILLSATTDAAGFADFIAIPDHFALGPSVNDTAIALLPALDVEGDGVLEYGGGDRIFSLRNLRDPTPDVVLDAGFTATLQVRASTIAGLAFGGTNPTASVIGINDPIFVTFNLPIQDTVSVTIHDEIGALVATPVLEVTDDSLTIPFNLNPLLAGREYNLHIHAVSRVGDRLLSGDFVTPFFTQSLQPVLTAVAVSRDVATQIVAVEFSEAVGFGGGVLSVLAGADCVLFFEVDLNATATIGDVAGEFGNAACVTTFQSAEIDPPGPVGLSGYSRFWTFVAPLANGSPIAAGTNFHITFGHVANAAFVTELPDGRVVSDFILTMP